jgi:hypothetical protein
VVRWLATDHETTVIPGSDAIVVTQKNKRKPTSGHAPTHGRAKQDPPTTSKYVDPATLKVIRRTIEIGLHDSIDTARD